ncbi:secretin N-terminal domain-containing protein [Pelomonas sp. KK5]|uniref:secretin N-terminal domain-containing protein n=1 Tax=Pelomonas sp. KK5 TaxID=1855730 RepID=UPI00097BF997|nr:secretin N-terminal domain-containing protein [Pelomonas sp. KK5]
MKTKPLTLVWMLAVAGLAGCANPALRTADDQVKANQLPLAWMTLEAAARQYPEDHEIRMAQIKVREQLATRLVLQIDGLRAAGRWDEARESVQRLREVDPKHPRLAWFDTELERGRQAEAKIVAGRALLKDGKADRAEALAREVLAESPQNGAARLLMSQAMQARPLEDTAGMTLGPAFQKPVTLEFRDAPLRQVFEALSRSSEVNFVFDRDVRPDARVTVFLRNVTLDEAMRVILGTQQLDRKLLNESSVLIYPATAAKQREHQELVTRTLYLTNADVKTVQGMVRTIAKVRDIHIDERLNLLVVRDTPEVVRLVEKLVASVDLPEPEVMLDVEVMELASDKVESLGLQWPTSAQIGFMDSSTGKYPDSVVLGHTSPLKFRASIANPAIVATMTGNASDANLLANPKIRVRNHDKAKVVIGEKVPVFTTTTNFSGQTSVAASVSYLDVGLKLEVEPSVQLDNDVIIKLNLEVSSLLNQVTGPGGTTAYQVGTRQSTTSLRLNDGETQVLAGLINDEDRGTSNGIPGLSRLPLLGKLFGVQGTNRSKTEVVMLITPHIVRNLVLPDSGVTRVAGGTDASPGSFSSIIRPAARVGGALTAAQIASRPGVPSLIEGAGSASQQQQQQQQQQPSAMAGEALVRYEVTPSTPAGGTVSVSLKNESGFAVKGEISYDAAKLQLPQIVPGASPGLLPIELPARGEKVVVLRALPAANGQVTNIEVGNLVATGPNGEQPAARAEGVGLLTVEMPK